MGLHFYNEILLHAYLYLITHKASLTVTALVTGMPRAAACFQSRILPDSFLWPLHVTAKYKYESHKKTFHLNKRYLGLLECDAAASSE